MSKTKQADNPPTHEEDPILTVTEVGRQIGRHHSTITNWVRDGLLEAIRMPGGRLGVRKSRVNELLRNSALKKEVV